MAAAAFDRDQDRGWQVRKPLAACLKYMLDEEIVCDVTFKIQKSEGRYSRVSAHKMILQARSPVFEAMFSGAFVEAGEDVVIIDVEEEPFKEMLRYMYTDEVVITGENVMHLLYAAKKYMLEDLSDKCKQYLASQITVDNVCFILTQSLFYQVGDLMKKCMALIEPNAIAVSRTEAFHNMSHDALLAVLRNDKLSFRAEADLFQGCLEWAKRRAKDKENSSGEELRELLGECLYKIRFPFITASVFAQQFSKTTVLTGEEKSHILALHLTKKETHNTALASLGFDVASRMQRLERFSPCNTNIATFELDVMGDTEEDFGFTSTKPMKLMGFSVYGGPAGSKHTVKINVQNTTDTATVSETETNIESPGTPVPIAVYINKICIEPNVHYRVRVSLKGPDCVGYGFNAATNLRIGTCSLVCTTNKVAQVYNRGVNPRYYLQAKNENRGYVGQMLLQTFNI